MKVLLILSVLAFARTDVPPDSLSLQYCYDKAAENYPVAKNIELQEKITEWKVGIAHTRYFPDLSLSGKASYQTEVTEFPIPGGTGPTAISKDQYEAALNLTQNIYSGGKVGIRKELERIRGQQQVHSTRIDLHRIREQVDQVYYGILLARQQAKTTDLLIRDLQKRLQTVRAQVKNGVLLSSQQYILEAEMLRARQDSSAIASDVRAGYRVLSELIGEEIDPLMPLKLPEITVGLKGLQPKRPEYVVFESSREAFEQQNKLAAGSKLPTVSAFGTAAFGRPGFNFLDDDFHDYYIVGVRVRWNFRDFLNSGREQQVLRLEREKVSQNQKGFTSQLRAHLNRLDEQMASIRENMERDREIIRLREKIVEQSASQLENGVITATEYVSELIRANRAKLSLYINKVKLSQTRAEYATALGVSPGE